MEDKATNLMRLVAISPIMILIALTQGCILISDASYAEKTAMWQAKAEASKAWAEKATQPLATFTAVSGETFTVNNPIVVQPLAVTGEPSAIVQGANVILNSSVAKIVGGGWAAGYMLGKVQGNYTAGDNGSINVTRDSGNTVDVTTRHIEDGGTISEEAHTGSDYVDSHDAVADPVIVNTPDPVIVPAGETIILRPEIVVVGSAE